MELGAKPFAGDHAAAYAEGPPRQVPGFFGLHRMTALLLAERTPPDARALVLGAGGGLELKSLAEYFPGWTFDGVDPSGDMLAAARQTVGGLADRMHFHEGYIADAPAGPFDAAVSLLTFHFIPAEARLETLQQLHARLKPGAPLVIAHISFSQLEPERSLWIERHIAFGGAGTMSPAQIDSARQAIGARLSILSPEDEERLLREAGFTGVSLFYAGFSFRGWVAYAG